MKNMIAAEVVGATRTKIYLVIGMWDHETAASHGPAKIAVKENVYKLLVEHMGSKTGADLVFTTNGGKRLTHIALST